MNLFILFLFIPLTFAGSPPKCDDLGKYLEGFEKDLHKKSIIDCKPDLYKTLVKDIPVKDPEFLDGIVCQDLSTIETQIEQAKLELAVLNGIEKLKLTVKEEKEKAEGPNAVPARVAAMSFVASLNTAQSLEVLLATSNDEDKPFIQLLKEFPDDKRATQKDLSDRLVELCKGRSKSAEDACNPKLFKPGPEAAQELLTLIKTSEPKAETVESWKKMLEIKRKNPAEGEDPAYSFNTMQTELNEAFARIDSKEVLSKSHLKAIAQLDDFESKPGLSFVEDLAALKNQKRAKLASDKFFLLMGDAKVRQEYEVQSKLSVVWNEVKDKVPELSEGQVQQCYQAKALFEEAKNCITSLENAMSKVTDQVVKSKLAAFLPALRSSASYADSLRNKENLCREELRIKDVLSETCYSEFNRDLATVQDKILQLNLVKDKIGSENMELMKYRNFALQKWGTQNCQTIGTPMDMCEDESLFSKDASMTFSESMKIALIFNRSEEAKTTAETEAEELCDAEDRKPNKVHDHLCDFFNDTTSDIIVTDNANKDGDGPLTAPDGGNTNAKIRDAWIQGGSEVLKSILGGLMPQQTLPPVQYPYPYNYNQYNGGTPPMGIADTIMFNARYHGGYGFYMPTPGYQPGTAFSSGPSMSSYNSVGNMGGKYFGK